MAVFLLTGLSVFVPAASAISFPQTAGNTEFYAHVKSMKEMKFNQVVRQTREFSCGAAALATILTYHFGRKTSEEEILAEILRSGEPEKIQKIRRMGVSLLDLKKAAEAFGYRGSGYRLPDHMLKEIDRPAIALVKTGGFSHFVVVRGILDEKVHIADPAKGNVVMDVRDFRGGWEGVLLMFKDPEGASKTPGSLAITKSPLKKLSLPGYTVTDVVRYMVTPAELN